MNLGRWIKARFYPVLPSLNPKWHEKRRKGFAYRHFPEDGLECQQEQDRVFWSAFLRPARGGRFLEIGGDGVTGSHTLGLELLHGWNGAVKIQGAKAHERARTVRKCELLGWKDADPRREPFDLLAIHQLAESGQVLESLQKTALRPRWVIMENREPNPQWCRLLEGLGYKLKFFFHDDEYYEFKA